jgi:hypothetical protein
MKGLVVLACFFASVQAPTPPETAVKSVRISVRPVATTRLRVTIENLRDGPLVESTIGLFPPGDARPRSRQYNNFGGYLGGPEGPGLGPSPIAPHERRVIEVDLPDSQLQWTPVLTLVSFANGYYEGTIDSLTPWREARQKEADDLNFWLRTMDTLPSDSADHVRRYLREQAIERAGQTTDGGSSLRDHMWTIANGNGELPDLLASLSRVRATASRQLTALQPSLAGPLSERRVMSAALSFEPSAATKYVVVIENLGTAPLEAWAWDHIDSSTGRARGGESTDMGGVQGDGVPGRGHILSGETRESPFGHEIVNGTIPSLRMKYALFDDLSFEGSATDRDALFRQRERSADDLAYAIAVLHRVAADPSQAVAVVTAARAERARVLQEQGRRDGLWQLDEFVRAVKASPANFVADAAAREASLQFHRQALLRHMKP